MITLTTWLFSGNRNVTFLLLLNIILYFGNISIPNSCKVNKCSSSPSSVNNCKYVLWRLILLPSKINEILLSSLFSPIILVSGEVKLILFFKFGLLMSTNKVMLFIFLSIVWHCVDFSSKW